MFNQSGIKNFNSNGPTYIGTASYMFQDSKVETFTSNLPYLRGASNIIAKNMFKGSKLKDFNAPMPYITDINDMGLGDCYNTLENFTSDLYSLTAEMTPFKYSSLKTFSARLDNLRNLSEAFLECHELESFDGGNNSCFYFANSTFENCFKLNSFNGNLGALTHANRMFYCTALPSFNHDLSSLMYGDGMFAQSKLESFDSNFYNLTSAEGMFRDCKNLTEFKVRDGINLGQYYVYNMFIGSTALKDWDCGLPNVTDINQVFDSAVSFETFTSDLRSLTVTPTIFKNKSSLKSFEANLYRLRDASEMFQNCYSLESFKTSDFRYIQTASHMFDYCGSLTEFQTESEQNYSTALTRADYMFRASNIEEFKCDYPKLDLADYMFNGCSALKKFDGKCPMLTYSNCYEMFAGCTSLIDFSGDFSKLENINRLFGTYKNDIKIQNFDCDLSSLVVTPKIFESNHKIKNFYASMPKLESANRMFFSSTYLESAGGDWSYLKTANEMFYNCYRMLSFNSYLPSLENADYMFQRCSGLKTFNTTYGYDDLGSLRSAIGMFKDCWSLTSFECDIPYLRVANDMFNYCQSLSSFSQNLTSLISGDRMFERCQSLTSFNSPLYSLVSANAMFKDCFQPTNRPYTHYYGYGYGYGYGYNSGPVYEGNCTFECRTMNNLICGENMFQNCYGLVSIKASMKVLEIGESMFQGMSALRTFSDYGTTSGYSNFSDNLRQLKNGDSMFKNTSFENVRDSAWNHAGHLEYYGQYALNASLGYLRTAKEMFAGCSRLSTFDCNLENLVNGAYMFSGSNLTGFYTESLGSLKTGAYMFYDYNNRRASARLKASEILNIANVINNIYGLNKQDDSQWTYEFPRFSYPATDVYGTMSNGDLLKDYQATTYNNPYYYNATGSNITYYNCIGAINPAHRGVIHLGSEEQYPQLSSTILNACQILVNKGWTVYVDSYKATACMSCCSGGVVLNPDYGILATSEIDLLDDNDEPIIPTVYYYKPVPVPESCASHVDQEGNFFTIMGGQLVFGDDLENYGQFTSFEEAEANMGLTRYNPNKQKKRKREEEQSQPEEENA